MKTPKLSDFADEALSCGCAPVREGLSSVSKTSRGGNLDRTVRIDRRQKQTSELGDYGNGADFRPRVTAPAFF
jgi:hypothetical protein